MNSVQKALGGSLLMALAATLSTPAQAVIGALDHVPAATLLLPYFEVDLADPNGPQTRFTVVNTAQGSQQAHVTLWTDMGVPTFDFDLFLGGRDSVDVDLRLLFTQGVVPQTTGTFPNGPDSDPHPVLAGCSATALYAGFPAPDQLTSTQMSHLQRVHIGKFSALFGAMCAGASHNDSVARGYVTIDAVGQCTSKFPTDSGYFGGGGTGIASDNNVLIGTYTAIERNNNVTAASPLVSIEASSTDPLVTTNGLYTFYAAYVGASAIDNREPLGTNWHARTLDVDFFDAGTDLVVWRDPGFKHNPFVCGNIPADFPRQQTGIIAHDEQEHPVVLNSGNVYPNPPPPKVYPLPLIAQRVAASTMSPFASGMIVLGLDVFLAGAPGPIQGKSASYVGVRHRFNGIYGAEVPAARSADCTIGCYNF